MTRKKSSHLVADHRHLMVSALLKWLFWILLMKCQIQTSLNVVGRCEEGMFPK